MLKLALISTMLLASTVSLAETKTINGEECYVYHHAPSPAPSPNPKIVKGATIIEYENNKAGIVRLIRDLETRDQIESYYGRVVKQPLFVSNVSVLETTTEEATKRHGLMYNGSRELKACGYYTAIISVESAAL